MYKFEKEDAISLLEKSRQIRQISEDMIAILEHLLPQKTEKSLRALSYDPDDYLNHEGDDMLYRTHKNLFCHRRCGCDENEHMSDLVNDAILFLKNFEEKIVEIERRNRND